MAIKSHMYYLDINRLRVYAIMRKIDEAEILKI